MIRIANIKVPLDGSADAPLECALKKLRADRSQVKRWHVSKKSVDARDKGDVHFVLSLDLQVRNEDAVLRKNKNCVRIAEKPLPPLPAPRFSHPPLVVGAGPAGLFRRVRIFGHYTSIYHLFVL